MLEHELMDSSSHEENEATPEALLRNVPNNPEIEAFLEEMLE